MALTIPIKGVFVAILGTDGAGKSTIINALKPFIIKETNGKFYQVHLRPGFLPALGRFRGVVHDGQVVTNPHGSKPSRRVGSLLRLSWLWLDYVIGYWIIVRPKIASKPAIFLFDRYAYDILFDPRRFRIDLPEWLLKFMIRNVPQPDLIICLYGKPAVIAARKQELPLREVERQIDSLLAFAKQQPNAVLLSTDGTIEQTRDEVLMALWDCCKRKSSGNLRDDT